MYPVQWRHQQLHLTSQTKHHLHVFPFKPVNVVAVIMTFIIKTIVAPFLLSLSPLSSCDLSHLHDRLTITAPVADVTPSAQKTNLKTKETKDLALTSAGGGSLVVTVSHLQPRPESEERMIIHRAVPSNQASRGNRCT